MSAFPDLSEFFVSNDPSPNTSSTPNRSEKKRNHRTNEKEAFDRLRRHIPYVNNNGHISKIKSLRLASQYIKHLQSVLDEELIMDKGFVRSLTIEDFKPIATEEMLKENNNAKRAQQEMAEERFHEKMTASFYQTPKTHFSPSKNSSLQPNEKQFLDQIITSVRCEPPNPMNLSLEEVIRYEYASSPSFSSSPASSQSVTP